MPVGFMAGVVARLGHKVRFIAEADTAHLFGEISDQANGFLGWYGFRFTSSQIGVDLALVKPFCGNGDCDTDTFPMGFPFVTFRTARCETAVPASALAGARNPAERLAPAPAHDVL